MSYAFEPKQKFAKACGGNVNISTKASVIICRAVRNKPLTRARRLLEDLASRKRSLDGKYYTKAVREILRLVNSCERNAEFLGLDSGKLFVHASAHMGAIMHRRRRKASFGTRIKSTNLEVFLIERGKESKTKASAKKIKEQMHKKTETEVDKELREEREEMEKDMQKVKQKQKEIVKEEQHLHEMEENKLKKEDAAA